MEKALCGEKGLWWFRRGGIKAQQNVGGTSGCVVRRLYQSRRTTRPEIHRLGEESRASGSMQRRRHLGSRE